MQQLIDKQVLLQALKKKRYSKQSLDLIESQPGVDAIPVEWLQTKVTRYVIGKDRKYSSSDLPIVYSLISDWRKENEKNI